MTSPSPLPQAPVPRCPNGLFTFDEGCVLVEDADEEIMEIYMSVASTSPEIRTQDTDSGGLGFLNSNESILDITIDLSPPLPPSSIGSTGFVDGSKRGIKKKVRSPLPQPQSGKKGMESVTVQIQQDLGMLKGQKGDTGSVLWRSSLHLATQLLRQYTYPESYPHPIFDFETLKASSILELGAGTGLLSILLSGSGQCARYTASDRLENLRLVKRNLELNGIRIGDRPDSRDLKSPTSPLNKKLNLDKNGSTSNNKGRGNLGSGGDGKAKAKDTETGTERYVNLEEIDWIAISDERKRHPELWNSDRDNNGVDSRSGERTSKYDLILAVDCIYNEYLVQPLIDTISRYCRKGGKGLVWVIVELRSADVLTLFLDKWTNDPSGRWTIVRLSQKMMGNWDGKKARWVGWVGWR
ncbi:uncharacterized protein I303_101500 [Kwoniella dejecticola CBS 10117]|uniref:Uncharacterized protein n=1 Tax=Kwoniella dejecticola CBS 10117 TaxID=1296121 RepID=A0A1A6ADK0_9TREE|nr:uncharacterized protein I303_02367 [Kwoniella dejecticola CBS 10117]OBR88147.1 hypothetical protein I303_02367 [Kwoniella dejecticola CBS 10117]